MPLEKRIQYRWISTDSYGNNTYGAWETVTPGRSLRLPLGRSVTRIETREYIERCGEALPVDDDITCTLAAGHAGRVHEAKDPNRLAYDYTWARNS